MKRLLIYSSSVLLATYQYSRSFLAQQSSQPQKIQFKSRQDHINECKNNPHYDLVVIGGGCNGSGVLLDACSRGYRTLLIQSQDFGSGTSSKSTKLIHGGVRYLQQVFSLSTASLSSRWQKFKLVKQALQQRSLMINNANYMNHKIPIVIPCKGSLESLYYYIGSVFYHSIYMLFSQKDGVKFDFPTFANQAQLKKWFPYISDKYRSGIIYEDGQFNDTQMLMALLLTATSINNLKTDNSVKFEKGNVLNRAEFLRFIKDANNKITGVVFRDKISNQDIQVKCKYVVNCTGPWADKIRKIDDPTKQDRIIKVAGSHMSFSRNLLNNKYGLCLASADGRILLILPWLNKTIVGTTQKKYEQATYDPSISYQEKSFITSELLGLCDQLNPDSLSEMHMSSWTGFRPLVLQEGAKDTKSVARTHVIEKSSSGLYSLMGGKWTTYRRMAEQLVDQIAKDMQKNNGKRFVRSATKKLKLIGARQNQSNLKETLAQVYGPVYAEYVYSTYGSLASQFAVGKINILDNQSMISQNEIDFIVKTMYVNNIEDVLLRRTRIAFLNNKKPEAIAPYVARALRKQKGWSAERTIQELDQFYKDYQKLAF